MVLPGFKTLKSLLTNSSHRRANGSKKLKEKGESEILDRLDAPAAGGGKEKSPVMNNKAAGHQVHPVTQTSDKLHCKLGGSPPLLSRSAVGEGVKSEGWALVSAERKEEYKKKVSSLPTGVAPPPYSSEELLCTSERPFRRTMTMTTSVTSPVLSSSTSRNRDSSSVEVKRRTIGHVDDTCEPTSAKAEGGGCEKNDPVKECKESRSLKEEEEKTVDEKRSENERILVASNALDRFQHQRQFFNQANVNVEEFEKERLLRQTAEERLREVTIEKDSYKEQIACLQVEIRKKETELQNGLYGHRDVNSKCNLDNTYEKKLQNCHLNVVRLSKVNSLLVKEIRNLEGVMTSLDHSGAVGSDYRVNQVLLERLKYLEAENASLVMESEQQRVLYERCLDDVANQVVQALLVQKSLQETCSKLKKRVDDLEQQNRTLHILFQQQLHRTWDPRSNVIHSSTVSSDVSPILPSSSSQFVNVGKKMARSTSSSTNCSSQSSSSSSGSRQSPCVLSASSEGITSVEYSPISTSGKYLHVGALHSRFQDEDNFFNSTAGSRVCQVNDSADSSSKDYQKLKEDPHVTMTDDIKVYWKDDTCSSCKECFRDDCCSACSCSNISATFPCKDQICARSSVPVNKEKRHVIHGPVMGMTDLLRLSNRKSVESKESAHQDNNYRYFNNGMSKQVENNVEMRLDNMITPSDDGQLCLYRTFDLTNQNDKRTCVSTAGNVNPSLKYKLHEDSSNGIVTTSWNGDYNNLNYYSTVLNAYHNADSTLCYRQRPKHLQLCKQYTLPSRTVANKISSNDNCCSFNNPISLHLITTKSATEECNLKNSNADNASTRLMGNYNNDGNESGLESAEVSPKDSLLCSSVSEDQEDNSSKKSGAKDEGYSTMSSDIQCDGEVDEQSRRASVNVSPDFLSFESSELKREGESKGDLNPVLNISNPSDQNTIVQISSQTGTSITNTESPLINTILLRDDSIKNNHIDTFNNREITFEKRSLLPDKTEYEEKFESETSQLRSSDLSRTSNINTICSDSPELQKPRIIIDEDADVFYLPIYCPLTSGESSKFDDNVSFTLRRSHSDGCIYSGKNQRKVQRNVNYSNRHHSLWELTTHINDDLMALYRSKACLTLAEDSSQLDYLSPFNTALLGWHSSFPPASLNSLHSLCSGSEASLLHEAPASRDMLSSVSLESSCQFSSSGDVTSDDAWIMADSLGSDKDFSTPLSETALNYNDEEICNWSLNFSSEELYPRRTSEDSDLDTIIAQSRIPSSLNGAAAASYGFYSRPSDSLPSIQEVDDDDGESLSYLPLKKNLIDNSSHFNKKERLEFRNKMRRKDGACNSWPNTADKSRRVWCKANIFTERLNSHHPSLSIQNSDSGQSWDSSMRCLSDDLSGSHSKSISVSSFGIGSGFVSTPESKSCVGQFSGALEETETMPLETHFTRDFYRLCKVESCRSLDVSYKNLAVTNTGNREVQNDAVSVNNAEIACEIKTNSAEFTNQPMDNVITDAVFEILPLKSIDSVVSEVEESRHEQECEQNSGQELKNPDESSSSSNKKEGCTTSWVHFEADVDLSDPKARANLLDSMLASSTSSSDTEIDSDTADDDYKYQHLHDIHRVRRFRRAFDREQCVVRYVPPTRPSILDRKDFFYRYGEQEKEAVASFDFLESLSTSISDVESMENSECKSLKKEDDCKSPFLNCGVIQVNKKKKKKIQDANRNSVPVIFNNSSHSEKLYKIWTD